MRRNKVLVELFDVTLSVQMCLVVTERCMLKLFSGFHAIRTIMDQDHCNDIH